MKNNLSRCECCNNSQKCFECGCKNIFYELLKFYKTRNEDDIIYNYFYCKSCGEKMIEQENRINDLRNNK
jgi:hypothetical protein